tara:strand:+ start:3840 stop:4655 length:816 start_codon:yes stop_codon:yes gene_type:complete
MFDGIVEVNDKKIRIIFPHKCGSGTFSNLLRSGYFDVPLISTNDRETPTEETHVYGRNPYRKTISSFFQMKIMSDSNLEYGQRTIADKVDEFRNFICETKKVWEEYGLIYNATKDFTEDLEIYYDHILPTCVDIFGCVRKSEEYDHMNIPKHMEEIKDKVIFHQLEDIRNNFVLKDYWKKTTDSFAPFDSFNDYLDKYKSMKQNTDTELYQHHKYYNSTNLIRKSPYYIFYDEETLKSVNSMFDMDFKFFDYPKCKSIRDIRNFTEEYKNE